LPGVVGGDKEIAEGDKIKQPSADDFARLTYSLKYGEMLIKQEFKFAGEVLEMAVMELEFEDGQEICSEELKKLVMETPKERRLQKELDPEVVKSALKIRQRNLANRFMIRRAMASFSPELAAGLEMDLKKSTRAELMQRLRPCGASKDQKRSRDNAKKEKSLKQVDRYQNTWPYLWLGKFLFWGGGKTGKNVFLLDGFQVWILKPIRPVVRGGVGSKDCRLKVASFTKGNPIDSGGWNWKNQAWAKQPRPGLLCQPLPGLRCPGLVLPLVQIAFSLPSLLCDEANKAHGFVQMAKTAKKVLKLQKMKQLDKTLGGVAAKIVEEITAVDHAWTQGVDGGEIAE